MSEHEPGLRAEGRQWIEEAMAGFMRDPADDDFQRGYLAALYVVGAELFQMDLGQVMPQPPAPRQATHLKLVK